jgi:hypothetical protein
MRSSVVGLLVGYFVFDDGTAESYAVETGCWVLVCGVDVVEHALL